MLSSFNTINIFHVIPGIFQHLRPAQTLPVLKYSSFQLFPSWHCLSQHCPFLTWRDTVTCCSQTLQHCSRAKSNTIFQMYMTVSYHMLATQSTSVFSKSDCLRRLAFPFSKPIIIIINISLMFNMSHYDKVKPHCNPWFCGQVHIVCLHFPGHKPSHKSKKLFWAHCSKPVVRNPSGQRHKMPECSH